MESLIHLIKYPFLQCQMIQMFVGVQLSTNKINAVRKTCNVYGVCLNIFIYENLYRKEASYKIFDSEITTFLLKLQAISFFAYEFVACWFI